MVNLSPLQQDAIAFYRSITNDKNLDRRGRLLALDPRIDNRYAVYQNYFTRNALEQTPIDVFTIQEEEDLLHCYGVTTKSLDKLIADIKNNQSLHLQGICQFCGLNTDSTSDHYLPKTNYPDFCVNALNLLPCCADCNSLKGTYYWDSQHNTRGIINLYTDAIPFEKFLFANINYVGNVPTINFYLQNLTGGYNVFFNIMQRHFLRLNLYCRYKERFNSVHHQVRSSFTNIPRFQGHPMRVKEFLLNDANSLFADYGRNCYHGVVKETLANNATFINQF
ncbi:MAG: hypothetical protein ABUL44_04585, partial [Flavobacterium sp.]